MRWVRKGHIYSNSGRAYLPTVDVLGDKLRIYFAVLDSDMIGDVYFIEVSKKDPSKILFESKTPCLSRGRMGMFDEHGVSPSCVITLRNGVKILYYQGWMKTVVAPQLVFSGLAYSKDGGVTFQKYSDVPILDRNKNEYIARSAPFVREEYDNDKKIPSFHIWYTSSVTGYEFEYNGKPVEKYMIRYGRSCVESYSRFLTSVKPIMPFFEGEFGLARPCVIKENGIYKMWYSIRRFDLPYRIGYAESYDGKTWSRMDNNVGIGVSESGWDSDMICFGYVVSVDGRKLMFYNGNGYGATGIGYAEEYVS